MTSQEERDIVERKPPEIKKLRAGYDFPCALHRGPKGDCNEVNCKCL